MKNRLGIQEFLEQLLGSANVYYQPPENLQMSYPAIRYELDYQDVDHADNVPYRWDERHLVTLITPDSEDPAYKKLSLLPMCRFSRFYAAGHLNHYVFNLYF